MLHFVLWPILAVWMGIAVCVLISIVAMLVWGGVHLLRDRFGVKDALYCPVQQRKLGIRGVPRRFVIEPVYSDVLRCEAWGRGGVGCTKPCIREGAAPA